MGISLENIGKTFNGVNKAAGLMNLSAADTEGVMLQLSQAMGSGALQGDELRSIMERLPAVGQAVARVMGVTVGEVKKLGSDGKITTDVIIKAMEELNKLKPPPPDAVKLYTAAMEDLQTSIGTKLLPVFTPFLQALTKLIAGFAALPQPLQNVIVGIGGLLAVVTLIAAPLGFLISGIGSLMTALAAAKVGATIAGWAALAGPAITAISAAFSGLLAFLTGTLLPGLLAFFSGPVGWTVLAVAAVVAMVIAFRKPLGDFINWLWNWGEPIRQFWAGLWNGVVTIASTSFNAIGGVLQAAGKAWSAILYQVLVQPWVNIWNNVLRKPITDALDWISNEFAYAMNNLGTVAYDLFVKPWVDLWENVLRGPVTAMIGWLENAWKDIGNYFRNNVVEPIRKYWDGLLSFLRKEAKDISDEINKAWKSIATFFENSITKPIQTAWNNLTTAISKTAATVSANVTKAWGGIATFFDSNVVNPIISAWNSLTTTVVRAAAAVFAGVVNAWNGIAIFFGNNVVNPIIGAWNNLLNLIAKSAGIVSNSVRTAWSNIATFFVNNVTNPISTAWQSLINFLPKAANTMGETVKGVFANIGSSIKGVLNSVLRGVFGAVNGAIANINRLIKAANALSEKVSGPQIPTLPTLSIPQFAKGGYVGQGTLAVVGEAGPEYIIPEGKMAAASANYLNGARGGAVIPAFANGGFVGGGNAQISVTTGPVLQQGGQQYVTMADLEKAMRKTADGVYASLRTPSSRIALGRA
jgi:tape measure domain-containing protein